MTASTTATDLGVAVIGSGYWGKNLVRSFSELGALRMVCDRDEAGLARVRQAHPQVQTALGISEALRRDDIQGIVIATPAETHFLLAREALLAGKHTYVEKPLALNVDEADELIALAEERGLILMVGHLLQYHPAFIRLLEMVRGGELGRIDYIYSNRLNLGKIRREENILWSFAPHDVSMILALTGEEPTHVIATGGNFLHRQIADVTVTQIEFASGVKAHIFVSWLHPFKEQKLVVVGEDKMAVFDDTAPWDEKLLLYPHHIRWEGGVPIANKAEAERVQVAQAEPLKCEGAHFLECIRSGTPPRTDGREGRRVLRVLNASQKSLESEGARVAVGGAAKGAAPAWTAHETAVVDPGVVVGEGTRIWHFSHVLKGSVIGAGCKIGQNVVIGPDVTVGNGCKIQNNVSVYPGVTLEDDVFCGPSMVFTNVFNPRAAIPRMDELRKTHVGRGATLGANCTIVCGVGIGRYAFVGAGAVVTKSVPDHALVAGNPARRIGWMCACGNKLDAKLTCPACGQRHRQVAEGLTPA